MADDWIERAAEQHREADQQRERDAAARARQDADDEQFYQKHLPELMTLLVDALQSRVDRYNVAYGSKVMAIQRESRGAFTVVGERAGARFKLSLSPSASYRTVSAHLSQEYRSGGGSSGSFAGLPHVSAAVGRVGLIWSNESGHLSAVEVADQIIRKLIALLE